MCASAFVGCRVLHVPAVWGEPVSPRRTSVWLIHPLLEVGTACPAVPVLLSTPPSILPVFASCD